MNYPGDGRWPPVYDAEDLRRGIKDLVGRPDLAPLFYEWRRNQSVNIPTDFCQGDIVSFATEIPLIHSDGAPATIDHSGAIWLVIGNSCDFDRSEVVWTQLVPAIPIDWELQQADLEAMRSYAGYRRFYLPIWGDDNIHYLADFTSPVTASKAALFEHGSLQARLSRTAWVLLNACLVRFLARDDGRYEP